jgi:ABC-type dipeptide/oligopeptide/nickel transport system permease subunit
MSVAEVEAHELNPLGQLEQPSSLGRDALDRFRHNKAAMVGVGVILLLVLAAVFAPLIAPYGSQEQVGPLNNANPEGPSSDHWMGLDEQGRDVFSRVVYGARLSLLVGLVSVAFGLSFGFVLGALAGYFGGWVETITMRTMDIMLAIPALLLAIGIITILGRGMLQIMLAVGITTIPIFARLLRGSILAQRQADYVLAARSLGVRGRRLLMVHIVPNALAPLIVQATLAMAVAIIDVAALAFLGFGPAEPGLPEWGKMLADNANRLEQATHLVIFPGAAIVISVLGLNLIGDGLRESIDPKLRS